MTISAENLTTLINVKSEEEFDEEKMITLLVMTSEAIRFDDVRVCVNAVIISQVKCPN